MGRKNDAVKIACENRKARKNKNIHEALETGIGLHGTDVKTPRAGKEDLKES